MKRNTILFFSMAAVLLTTLNAQAEIILSVTPVHGGNSLRFGRVSSRGQVNREVRIRITSTDGNQYQVFHRLADSLRNEKNASLGNNVMTTYTLLGSNASGTLYAQNVERLGQTDQLLYSSGSGGESDSFTVAYTIDSNRVNATGDFFGRIQYTVRPVGGAAQDTVILNVTAEISGEFKIDVRASSSADSIRLEYRQGREQEEYVKFAFAENLRQDIQIFQDVELFPQNEVLDEINDRLIMFKASGSNKGELFPRSFDNLTRKRVLVYSSKESEDEFFINFILNEGIIGQQKTGNYKGKLKYIVQTDQTERVFDIRLEVEIEPVFAIDVDLPPGGLSFERLLPDSQPMIREVKVKVTTNLEKPYMIMQNVISPLTNEEGVEIPGEYFTLKGELFEGETGEVAYTDFLPVPSGENPIFFSDTKGSPSHFKVMYRLRPYPEMLPGGYTTSTRYTLGEM